MDEQRPSLKTIWGDKKKRARTIMIASVVAVWGVAVCLLVAIISPIINNSGKDFYERFTPGTSMETIFDKLDSWGMDYEVHGTKIEVEGLTTVQGLKVEPDSAVRFLFDDSDTLEQISVFIFPRSIDYTNKVEMDAWCDNLVSTLDEKYGYHSIQEFTNNFFWETKAWQIYHYAEYRDLDLPFFLVSYVPF